MTAKSALDTFKEWKELIVVAGLTLSSALAGIFGNEHPSLQRVSWVLALAFVAVGAYVVHRKQRRKQEQARREKIWTERAATRKAGSAFRSLAPFEERDNLPGKDRKLEARAIATRIASDDFRFGVLCGDTGCGKTSMLRSEVTRVLRESGLEVAYIRNPRRLETKISEALPPKERLASELRALTRNHIKPTTSAVILDQFEEWFIEYQLPEQRAQLGKFIRKLVDRPQRVRIVCAIRREFLVDFHDLSDELPQQLSPTNLFHIKNLTVDQARDVINECATADGVAPDASFAETAADDLAEGGLVRPPELQIVCTYLAVSGSLNTPKYRQAGGTAGILAHYIQEILGASKNRAVAARLLRALCDFPAHAKQRPQSLDELVAAVGSDSGFTASFKKEVSELAYNFVVARVLIEEPRKDGPVFALMHDYLVDAIQFATADASTKTEEANQLLRYYVAERHGVIPLRKLRFILAFADQGLLKQPRANRLLWKSTLVPAAWIGALGIVSVALAASYYLFESSRIQWRSQLIDSYWGLAIRQSSLSVEGLPGKHLVIVGRKQPAVGTQVWDAEAGKLLCTVYGESRDTTIGPSAGFLMNELKLLNLSNCEEIHLPGGGTLPSFTNSEKWISWVEPFAPGEPMTLAIYSSAEREVAHRLAGVPFPQTVLVSEAGDRLLLVSKKNASVTVDLYDVSSERLLGTLKEFQPAVGQPGESLVVSINESLQHVCAVVRPQGSMASILLWDLRDGKKLKEYYLQDDYYPEAVNESDEGSHIIISSVSGYVNEVFGYAIVLHLSDEKPADEIPVATRLTESSGARMLFWQVSNGVKVWNASSSPRFIEGFSVDSFARLLLSHNLQRAAVWKNGDNPVQLWDFTKGKLIARLHDYKGDPWAPTSAYSSIKSVSFAANDSALILIDNSDNLSLFDAVDGEPLIQQLPVNGAKVIYYDRDCRRLHLWNEAGQVFRYTEGRSYFGKFVPTRKCIESK
ncbi:MAG TPA: WD40 repeat domain-containing protein [Pyrinomonadaceae bacterium]|nr:WD40 repeat domain-containing protein [Pyrinomonadaceae bacterium]